jgi:MYXO-CTERM domain-containing protein
MSVRPLALFLLLLCQQAGSAAVTTLYDPTLGNTPGAQSWLLYANDSFLSGGTVTETAVSGGTRLVTDNAVSAGYSNYLPLVNTFKNAGFPSLDRGTGFTLRFELEVDAESHANNNRAGFSVILLANDLFGIELGFWTDRIWAQSGPAFTQAEGVAFDTTGPVVYELTIQQNGYTLTAGGSTILTDSLRDYSSFGVPYNLQRFVFLGDNTSSAGADVTLGAITLTNDIPEPATIVLAPMGLALLALVRRRRS